MDSGKVDNAGRSLPADIFIDRLADIAGDVAARFVGLALRVDIGNVNRCKKPLLMNHFLQMPSDKP
jgi:hypothetical protein